MLKPKVYTPRSSFDATREPVGFLTLPAELRIRIYEHSFTNIEVQPLIIKRYYGHPWLYRQPKIPKIPPVLLTNKQIYHEAREVLHKVCFNTTDQPIVIEHIHYDFSNKPLPKPRDYNDICAYRPVRAIAPVLRSLPRIRLEVVLCGCFEDQIWTITLLRWMRAVLNSRAPASCSSECHVPLTTLDVVFIVTWGQYRPKASDGVVRAVAGIAVVAGEMQVWSSWSMQRPLNRQRTKVDAGHQLDISGVRSEVEESEASAWEGMKRTWKRVQIAEDPNILRRERARLESMSFGQRLSTMGEKLVGTFRLRKTGDGLVGRSCLA